MATPAEMLKQGRYEELWQRCCGFITLSLDDFMRIQQRLLLEQIELLGKCRLGKQIMLGASPRTVAEFREQVPLTTYADYAPYLLERREDVLPERPMLWQHTSGRSGEYPFKWVPLTVRQFQEIEALLFACLSFACCKWSGDIAYRKHDKFLYALAPPPYTTGALIHAAPHELFDFLPPVETAEGMSFEERIRTGFEMALSEGLDLFFALSSVIMAIGERFSQRNGSIDVKPFLGKPKTLFRLLRGLVKSKLARRPLLPRDIWSLKGLVSTGSDGSVFREKIKEMWGRYPLDVYAGSEPVIVATQTWDYQGMTFVPHLNFLEFIPEVESLKSRVDPGYQPSTLLLNEIKAGENYEIVITSFLGGPFIRYKLGDMVKIISLRNEVLNIDIPQMLFHSRVDDIIDIAGFTRLTEKVIWQAIENSGIAYKDWVVCKEAKHSPVLHLYLELRENGHLSSEAVAEAIHYELKRLDAPYADLEALIGLKPLQVTLVPENAFNNYMLRQQAAGADLAHLKPRHINPSDGVIDFLLSGSVKGPVGQPEHELEAVS